VTSLPSCDRGGGRECDVSGGGLSVDVLWATLSLESTARSDYFADRGGAISLEADAVLHSENTDWGDGSDDNDPHDVDTNHALYDTFTTGETFTCESSGLCH